MVIESKYNRSKPAPIGEKQTISVDNIMEKYTVEATVKEVVRGDNALSMLKQAYKYNSDPKAGYDYIIAKINFKLLDINEDKTFNIYDSKFKLYSSDYKEYESPSVVSPDPVLDGKLYKGASTEGYAVYQVKTNDTKPTLVFGQNYDGTGGIWFKAYK